MIEGVRGRNPRRHAHYLPGVKVALRGMPLHLTPPNSAVVRRDFVSRDAKVLLLVRTPRRRPLGERNRWQIDWP